LVVFGSAEGTNLVDRVVVEGSGTNFTATISLLPDRLGTDRIILTAADDLGSGTNSFALTVIGPTGPTIGPIANQSTPRNIPLVVPLVVTDPDTPLTALDYTFATSNTNLVRNVTFGVTDVTNVFATVLLVRDAVGTATVSIFVDDGTTKVGQAFVLDVFKPVNQPPVLGPIPDQTTTANTPVVITLDLTDPDTSLQNMVYTSQTSNPGVVSGVTVDTTSGAAIATVGLVTDATGIGTVTITVNDGDNIVSRTFALSVSTSPNAPVLATPVISEVGGVKTITVTWTNGGQLETAPAATGPWTGTGNTSGSFSEPVSGPAKFYRIRK
jgi:hypothetical protein